MTQSKADGPLWHMCADRTIGGLPIDFTRIEHLRPLHLPVLAYRDELAMYACHGLEKLDGIEASEALDTVLESVASCRSVYDVEADDVNENIRKRGALGLRQLHEVVKALVEATEVTAEMLCMWNAMSLSAREAATLWYMGAIAEDNTNLREQARNAAIQRHANGPFAEAKRFARDVLSAWDQSPHMYPSNAAFARDITDKFPDIQNPVTVERWVRRWRQE
jgi:hypothetical protein